MRYRIAGDLNFVYGAYIDGATLRYIDLIISTYLLGGVSENDGEQALAEKRDIVGDAGVFKRWFHYYLLIRTRIRRKILPKFIFNFLVRNKFF